MHVVNDTGWIGAGGVRTGVAIRVGLVWPADPGVALVTARCDVVGSTVTRTDPARELRPLAAAPYDETVEWITVRVDAPPHEFVDIDLGYAVFQ